jgi:hypothetical protein
MKYILLFCGTEEDQAAFDALSPDELRERYALVGKWFMEHRSTMGSTHQLQPRESATTVRFGADGKSFVKDGPFIEGNEIIGGYAEIDVADLDQALKLASSWPGGGAVEIRPVVAREQG